MLQETLVLFKTSEPLVTRRFDPLQATGGYKALEKAWKWNRKGVMAEVKEPVWGRGLVFLLVWNELYGQTQATQLSGDQRRWRRTGTFRSGIMLHDPHMFWKVYDRLLRGGCHHGYIPVQGEFVPRYQKTAKGRWRMLRKIWGWAMNSFGLDMTIHREAGAYICGSTAVNSEGNRDNPGQTSPRVSGFNGSPACQ